MLQKICFSSTHTSSNRLWTHDALAQKQNGREELRGASTSFPGVIDIAIFSQHALLDVHARDRSTNGILLLAEINLKES